VTKWRTRWRAVGVAIIATAWGEVTAAPANCKLTQIAEWPVRVERNRILVEGAINGQKIGVMLDTGAGRSVILRSAAARLGLTRRPARNYRMFGVGGETNVEVALVDEFAIGETVRKNWRVLVAGDHDFGDDVAMLLGEDFFQLADVEFDLTHNAVRLFQPRDCGSASLAYWASDGVSEVQIDPIDGNRPQVLLTVLLNGKDVKALLDSGAATSLLNKVDAARAGVTPETPGTVPVASARGLGSRQVDSWIGTFQTFTIGNETIWDTPIRFADLFKDATVAVAGSLVSRPIDAVHSMLLGFDFLRAHRLLIAHSQGRIYFTYAGGPVFQRSGARAVGNDGSHDNVKAPAAAN